MDQALPMQIAQRVQHKPEHVLYFRRRQGALRENLRKIFFSVFHHDVEKIHVRETATAALVQLKQIGMREFGSAAPERKLQINRQFFRKQFDYGFGGLRAGELREENGGFAGAAYILQQRKGIVD